MLDLMIAARPWALLLSVLCATQSVAQHRSTVASTNTSAVTISLPAAFPRLHYTPFGYIDNPYQSMVFNRSGVIRSVPPLGFGWWRTDFGANYGEGVRGYVDYYSFLGFSIAVGNDVFATREDFQNHGVDLVSEYHSKQMVSYDWIDSAVTVSLRYCLARENSLACLLSLKNSGNEPREITIHATNTYGIGGTKWWGSDGLTARFVPVEDAIVAKIWAYGDVFVLGSSLKSVSSFFTESEKDWTTRIHERDTSSTPPVSIRGRGPIRSVQVYRMMLPPGSERSALFCLSRGKSEIEAVREKNAGLAGAPGELARQLRTDQDFWSGCPVLDGDWPKTWQRGWVYDFETLRMNVRRPIGIFKHPWDGMQVHSPRVVLGETSLDMMTLSYADPSLACDVLLGTFEDALMPNIPCVREDGSMNMISSDGSECGTAPMWGFPFHVINAIYESTGDAGWIKKLYPRLKAYIDWWLKNRTDAAGWLHCNNSWESGQDGSKRFLVAEGNEGAVADFVRTVDVEASMAEAMQVMGRFAAIAGHPGDRREWEQQADRRIRNVRAMFVDGWFRDIDGRTDTPILLDDPYDVMMLAPLACNVATPEQVTAVAQVFPEAGGKMERRLQWPPAMQTFVEAAWNAGASGPAAAIVAQTADRVYGRTDARTISIVDRDDPLSYRIPGVANEFWPTDDVRPGGENYGWGATLPMHIIRAIVGFREHDAATRAEFFLAPSIPEGLAAAGKTFSIKNLHFRKTVLDVTYSFTDDSHLGITVAFRSSAPVTFSALTKSTERVLRKSNRAARGNVSFDGINGGIYLVRVD